MAAGIEDVARAAGVSTATVSRALRGLPHVSESTRERVRRAAGDLGYVASPSAVSLATGRTRTVCVITPHVGKWFFAQVLEGAEAALRERGYDVLLHAVGSGPHRARVDVEALRKKSDGLVVLSLALTQAEIDALQSLQRPIVYIGTGRPGASCVRIDDEAAARAAVDHLLALGHRRIGHVSGDADAELPWTSPRDRCRGYAGALRDAGLPVDPDLEVPGDFTVEGGAAAARRLLDLPHRPTAVVASSDEMAAGVLRAAAERGLRVPDDLSVVGIDDHQMADVLALTTVRQDVQEQGRLAALRVLEEVGGTNPDGPVDVVLPTRLVVRDTTAGVRART